MELVVVNKQWECASQCQSVMWDHSYASYVIRQECARSDGRGNSEVQHVTIPTANFVTSYLHTRGPARILACFSLVWNAVTTAHSLLTFQNNQRAQMFVVCCISRFTSVFCRSRYEGKMKYSTMRKNRSVDPDYTPDSVVSIANWLRWCTTDKSWFDNRQG